MKFRCPLILVEDMERSKRFYQTVLGQTIKYDFRQNVLFEGDFCLHEKKHFAALVRLNEEAIGEAANNVELYFEEDEFDAFLFRLEQMPDICYLHRCRVSPWGQRVVRFYDPDGYLIEVGESMTNVAKNFLAQGIALEDVALRTQYPLAFVEQCYEELKLQRK